MRQLYPILLSVTVAIAIGVYMHPGEARQWIRQAGQWGSQVASDALRATVVLADEARSSLSQPGYASTGPSTSSGPSASSSAYDPTWTYVADDGRSTATLGSTVLPPASAGGYAQAGTLPPGGSDAAQRQYSAGSVYPRVLASSPGVQDPGSRSQPLSPYESTGSYPASGISSPSAHRWENPLRPSMPREAPWSATAGGAASGSAPAGTAQAIPSDRRLGAVYPKVQWAGDWSDYRGVPETVKPTDQSGYLPPPDANSTAATVDRYLPSQAQNPNPSLPGVGVQQQPAASSAIQTPGVAAPGYPLPPYGATQNNTAADPLRAPMNRLPAAPALPQSSSLPVQAAQTAPYPPDAVQRQSADPLVASLPALPAVSGTFPAQPVNPPGVQMESADPVADLTICEGAQILARVGSEVILASEVLPLVNETLSNIKDIEKASDNEIAKAREQLVKNILPKLIEMKLWYVDAKRNIPAEAIENVNKQLNTRFEEVEVSERLKKLKVSSRRELEARLAQWGTSLDQEKRAFIERAIVGEWIRQKLDKDEDITHEELLEYYQAHATEYYHPTRVRWEHLEVTFRRHPDKREAWQHIAMLGNAVQQGQPFAQVAQTQSEGIMASNGGQHDWLTQGSLKSDILDRALFSLPPGTLSPILEDETGFHIVRVIERENAYRTPFEEVQTKIRESLQQDRKQARQKECIARLREEIPVWTVFDQQQAQTVAPTASSAGQISALAPN